MGIFFRNRKLNKVKHFDEEILLDEKKDRRLTPDVPSDRRTNIDRRGSDDGNYDSFEELIHERKAGIRYVASFPVKIIVYKNGVKKQTFTMDSIDVSETGILLKTADLEEVSAIENGDHVKLIFEVPEGSMPEGHEVKFSIAATLARVMEAGFYYQLGFSFAEDLGEYLRKRKDRYVFISSAVLLFFISFVIVLMRSKSFIYFKFHKVLYLYSIMTAGFLLTRYIFGAFYKPVPIDPNFTPTVTLIIPCFNEETWIQRTVVSCVNQNYPPECLQVIIVDDCSTDNSVQKVNDIIDRIRKENPYFDEERLFCLVQEENAGKRAALVRGIDVADGELIIFVDSDSFLDPYAVRNLVQPFKDPKMGGVAGRTDVANTYTNALTKMQSVRYYIAFRIMKAAEGLFDAVTCLSGPLSCYRKSILLEKKDEWINQKFLGQKATFGDDRSMTNMVLKEYRTTYQDTAFCSTIVPSNYKSFLTQQMRWKRSWIRESLMAGAFMWKKEPYAAIVFYIGLMVPILAPVVVIYNLLYVPLTQHIFPTTFLVGLLLMSLMMSAAQLLLRKSSTWFFGFLFCVYYEAILLWQMPIAWFTFWKSTWGTRMTPSDVAAMEKKEKRKRKKEGKDKADIKKETGDIEEEGQLH
ncbi:MAG: glycosyltransferase [Lachnospiraceae bacterium]|nr:glycosyltransferase [Lachnospiraceae bacterium]